MSLDKFPFYFAAILITSAAVALFSLPVAVLLFTLSVGVILVRQYLQVHAIVKEENKTTGLSVSYVIGCIAIIFVLIGYSFKIMHWPFAGPLYMLATVAIVITAICTAIVYLSDRSTKHNPLPYLLLLIPFMFVFCTSLIRAGSDDKRIATVNSIIKENELAEMQNNTQAKLNTIIYNSVADSTNDSLSVIRNKTSVLRLYIHSIKEKLIEITGGKNEDGEYKGKLEATAVEVYLIGTEGAHNGEAYKLDKHLKAYYALCGEPFLIHPSPKGIQTVIDSYFPHNTTLAEALNVLTHIERSVLQVEEEYYLESGLRN